MLLLTISFVGGVLTVLAPCILPLLPVVIGGSLGDGKFDKRKALTIITSLGVSVIVFTLLLKASTLLIDIPPYVWSYISGGIIAFLGLVFLFPALLETGFMARLSAKSNVALGSGVQRKSVWGDVITGAALGPVFSTCSPTYFIVIATVLPVSPLLGLTYMFAYVIGLSLALLLVALLGQKIVEKLGIVADPRGKFKKVLGLIFIIVGLAIIFGFDKKSQLFLLDLGLFDITKVEQQLLKLNAEPKPDVLIETEVEEIDDKKERMIFLTPEQKSQKYSLVPELSSIDGYINTSGEKITLSNYRGKKVVLLDIWTYSCINCQRTIPYLNEWYTKYKDQGLEIIGLHTPEFAFERVLSNVEKAVKDFGIEYPVVLDNDYSTWNALGNQFWPRKYLIDVDGYIVYDHAGEGNYEETERAIQKALLELKDRLKMETSIPVDIAKPDALEVDYRQIGSPEIYFGLQRSNGLDPGPRPSIVLLNRPYLVGNWQIYPEFAESLGETSIIFKYRAKNVYMVAASDGGVEVEVFKNDVLYKKLNIKGETLYKIIEGTDYGEHILEIKIPKAGLKAFTFTFG